MTPEQIQTVERLREAAREHGEVRDLLRVLSSTLSIVGGTPDVVADDDELEYLKAALLAADFVMYDGRGK